MACGSDLADEIRRVGTAAGLDHVGICGARPFAEVRVILEERVAEGLSAGMQFTYRNPERSTDPQRSLQGARSLVVGCLGYSRERPDNLVDPTRRGSVATYSWTDYYRTLRAALVRVSESLVEHGWRTRVLVDDNALVDRAAAVRAGLGWYGKSCNVLVPGAGSRFVLGSVVTDAPLAGEADPAPVEDGCGACRRCLDDCPTGALVAPGRLDARRCLAWLLQAPGVFPVEFREALGDRLYGCDGCQDGCPPNRLAIRRRPPPKASPGAQAEVDVVALLTATDDEIASQVGRWYIPRREMRYVRRNALIVLGNVGDGRDAEVEAVLVAALRNDDPVIRAHAVWAARRLDRSDLLGWVADEADPAVIDELRRTRVSDPV
jgi:epoxyqueuosine reductase